MRRLLLLTCLLALPGAAIAQAPGVNARVGASADPAFRDCRSWCQVRIEGAQVRSTPDLGGPGMMRPELWLAVRVRNVSAQPAPLDRSDIVFQATNADVPHMGDIAISDGPWAEPRDTAAYARRVIEPGQSVLVHYRFWRLPDDARAFHLKADGQFAVAAQAWAAPPLVADYRELERNLFLEGKLGYIPSHVAAPVRADDFVGEWDRDGQRVVVTRNGNRIVVRTLRANGAHQDHWEFGATPHPDRLLAPDDRQLRVSMSDDPRGYLQIGWDRQTLQMSTASRSGSGNWTARRVANAGGGASQPPAPETPPTPSPPAPAPPPTSSFQPLGGFGLRFGGLERPRGSNVVRALVTIRNESSQVQHLPSGTFRVILTDADGAGQERNQLWRGSGEPAQLFNGTPTLQPGAELTVRFTFNPDGRDLDSLVLMRGGDQVEFDLSGL